MINFFEIMDETGPVIRYDDNGRRVFIFNPFYRGKDPMKEIFWEKQNVQTEPRDSSEILSLRELNMVTISQLIKSGRIRDLSKLM